jgi:hypothetical protein
MAIAVGSDVTVQALNDELYLMSRYGRKYGLNKDKDEKLADEEDVTVTNGLVFYDECSDPQEGRRSRTALLLDSIAEICLSRPGQVYAVACVVPLKRPHMATPLDNAAASASSADNRPTLIVAENSSMTLETQRYLHDVIQRLQRISILAKPLFPSDYDPYSWSPRAPEQPSIHSEFNISFFSCLLCSTRFRLSLGGRSFD